jgi:hypothetical protein
VLGRIGGTGFLRNNLNSVSEALSNAGAIGHWEIPYYTPHLAADAEFNGVMDLVNERMWVEVPSDKAQEVINKAIEFSKAQKIVTSTTKG